MGCDALQRFRVRIPGRHIPEQTGQTGTLSDRTRTGSPHERALAERKEQESSLGSAR
jgi:hypothetical protein